MDSTYNRGVNKKMQFGLHPSSELVDLYRKRPFQGQIPEQARVIFLSSDANYSPEISTHPFFKYIIEYQENGVAFWEKYGVHHPFLLPDFPFNKTTGGRPFHKTFSKLGLDSDYAEYVCFLELLDVPTIGNKSGNMTKFYEMVSTEHLDYIERLFLGGGEKLFFVSGGVMKDLTRVKKKYNVFCFLNYKYSSYKSHDSNFSNNRIKEIYHFSSSQIHGQIADIRSTIDNWIGK